MQPVNPASIPFNEVDEIQMTPAQLWRAVVECKERVNAPQVVAGLVDASVQLYDDGMVYMWGLTGRHSLNLAQTDAERLYTHWQGFKEISAARARKEWATR